MKMPNYNRFRQDALKYAFNNGGYILRGWSVYQVFYGVNVGYHCDKIYTKPRSSVPLTNRGFWHAMDAKGVNKIVGFELLNED